ncbi:VOC family protein [Parasporobacterium paucivorans]|uniref:Glyoxalase/Bleomycin resistance-like N-terminal domain-containing protein n=1 Tax=Parasporobacterium paucivorans DSM 15970 TaxID=1122934 RepID=A0A1M6FDA3_9FIRM|nr:VOC family protein [Parasporobacterium paucivorans]SHI95708.1 hypothetical protein SAMN02745691_01118 [Parasporobacterium paucivorans DSM 15970]
MPTIVHFDIAADDTARAKAFYETLFDWNFTSTPGFPDFYLIETKGQDGSPGVGGGLGLRGEPSQRITNYIGVASVDAYCEKVEILGGRVIQSKMPVPGWGYLAVCMDTEGNAFGLWQEEKKG